MDHYEGHQKAVGVALERVQDFQNVLAQLESVRDEMHSAVGIAVGSSHHGAATAALQGCLALEGDIIEMIGRAGSVAENLREYREAF